jgi:hypothetical protein
MGGGSLIDGIVNRETTVLVFADSQTIFSDCKDNLQIAAINQVVMNEFN